MATEKKQQNRSSKNPCWVIKIGSALLTADGVGLDEVAIFDTEKDSGWVTSVYNTGQKKLDLSGQDGLVGYWKFNEGSGTTVKDYSGNGNHGTFAPISGDTTAYPTWEKN